MLTDIGLKLLLKIGQHYSKHTYIKTFDRNNLSISIKYFYYFIQKENLRFFISASKIYFFNIPVLYSPGLRSEVQKDSECFGIQSKNTCEYHAHLNVAQTFRFPENERMV